jgi:hypothetical protein
MENKIAIATIASNTEYYYKCCKFLIKNFTGNESFKVFVYTDNVSEFKDIKDVEIIKHDFSTTFDFHSKFTFINQIRNRGYNKILYMDSDLILINSEEFIRNIISNTFNPGFSYNRFTSIHFKALLETNPRLGKFKEELIKNNVEFRNTVTPWEDLMYFNFEGIEDERIAKLFETYEFYVSLRRKASKSSDDDLRGEGAVFGLALSNCEFPSTISKFLYDQLINFRDNHYPPYEDIPCISTEVCAFISVDGLEENYPGVLETTVNFYKNKFKNLKYFIIEKNNEETLRSMVVDQFGYDYVFADLSSGNSESQIILDILKNSKKNIIFYIKNGSILLDVVNIKNSFESILRNNYDYIVPFVNAYYLPEFILNNSDFESKIFISSVNEHKRLFEENPWSTHKERHDVMIASNLKYRNLPNDLICLENTNPIIKKRLL